MTHLDKALTIKMLKNKKCKEIHLVELQMCTLRVKMGQLLEVLLLNIWMIL
jgi:hypothetical protein